MITFKLNGKPIEIATSWDEFNYNQWLQVVEKPLEFKQLVAVCAGIPDDENLQKAQITGNIEGLVVAMNFIKKPPVWDGPVFKCGPYTLPINHKGKYNIQYAELQQFEDMRNIMGKIEGTSTLERTKSIAVLYPSMVAIYLQKVRDGEYSYNKAMDMVEEIKTYPAREVVTLGSFFLVKLQNLLNGTPVSSPTTSQNPKKKKPATGGSRKHSGRSPRSRK